MRPWKLRSGMWKLIACAMLALGIIVPLRASSTDTAVLKRIGSRVDERAGVITIEASDPVPYVASQPDPRVFIIELRDTKTAGFTDQFTADPRNPVAAVQVENAHAIDGVDVARVRLT